MSEIPDWAKQFMPLDAAEKAAEIRLSEELKRMTEKISELQHADCNNRIAALTAEREQYRALMELACADVIFFHSQEHGPFLTSDEPRPPETIAFSILVNDLFYPAADAEGFDISEAIRLRDVFRKDGMEGIIRWVQQKRDNLPLRPHVEERVKEQEGLRQEVAALKATVERLSAPVSMDEAGNFTLYDIEWINALIAARTNPPAKPWPQIARATPKRWPRF